MNTAYMWKKNTLQLAEYAYPSLYFYLEFALQKITYGFLRLGGAVRSSADFLSSRKFWDVLYVTGRGLSVFLTLLLFLLLFKLSSEEFSPITGVLASVLLSFNLIDVVNSRLAKPDSLLNFLLIFTVFYSVKFFKKGSLSHLLIASAGAGLCVSAKYFFIGAFPVFFAIILREGKFKEKIKNLTLAAGVSLFSFLLTCPYCILDYREVIKTFSGAQNFKKGYIVPVHHAYAQVFPDLLKYTGYLVFIIFILGLVLAFLKDWKINLIIFSFPAIYLLMLSITKVYGPRYLVYLFPYVSLYAGFFLFKTVKKPALSIGIALLLSLPMFLQSAKAVDWLMNRFSNREIMADFISNSLPNPKMVVSYHAYWLPTTRYSNFPRYSSHIARNLFLIYGAHEKYFCSPGSRFLKWCGSLLKALPEYWQVLSLPDPPMPYAIDFSMALLRKRKKPAKPSLLFPALVKLPGKGKLIYPSIPYVRDALMKRVYPLGSVEKYYLSQGEGEVCVLVRRISRTGKYKVIFAQEKTTLNKELYYRCKKPGENFGRIEVKSSGPYLEVFITSSPINLAQVLSRYFPREAETFLKDLRENKFYSFEANRLLYDLYRRTGRQSEASSLKRALKPKAVLLLDMALHRFRTRYRRAGFDPAYLSLSQRIYPEFERGKRKSRRFYLLPGVYFLSRDFAAHL